MAHRYIYFDRDRPKGDWTALRPRAEGLYWTIRQRLVQVRGPLAGCLVVAGAPMTLVELARETGRPRPFVSKDLDDLAARGLVEAFLYKGDEFARVAGFKGDQDRIGRSRRTTDTPIQSSQEVTREKSVSSVGKPVGDNSVDNSDPLGITPIPCGKLPEAQNGTVDQSARSTETPIQSSQEVTREKSVSSVGKPVGDNGSQSYTQSSDPPIESYQEVTSENPVSNVGDSSGEPYHMIRSTTTKAPSPPSGARPSPAPGAPGGAHPIEPYRPDQIDPIESDQINSRRSEQSGRAPEGGDGVAAFIVEVKRFAPDSTWWPGLSARICDLSGLPDGLGLARAQLVRVQVELRDPDLTKRPANPGSRLHHYLKQAVKRHLGRGTAQ